MPFPNSVNVNDGKIQSELKNFSLMIIFIRYIFRCGWQWMGVVGCGPVW